MTALDVETETVPVTLGVPAGQSCQLVYRQDRTEPFDAPDRPDVACQFLAGPADGLRAYRYLSQAYGRAGAAKALAKLSTGRRSLYLLTVGGRVVSGGWCTVGRCRYYRVGTREVVIGPIWTDPATQSRGLATFGLQRAVNALLDRGFRVFFIDTEWSNLPCQRVIEKCGFGRPTALYLR